MDVPGSSTPPPPPPDYFDSLQDPANWTVFTAFFGTQGNVSSATVDGRSNAVLFTVPSSPSPHDNRVVAYANTTLLKTDIIISLLISTYTLEVLQMRTLNL